VVATYRMWIATYPDDWVPHNNLSTTYVRLNRLEEAVDEARASVRLAGNSVVAYQQLTRALLALGRLPEAKAVTREAIQKGRASSVIHMLAYQLAFIDKDAAAMEEHVRATADRADSYVVLTEAARAAVSSGDVDGSRTLYAQAVAAARTARANDIASTLVAEQALGNALVGDTPRARDQFHEAMAARGSGDAETTWTVCLAAAFLGRAQQANQLAQEYRGLEPPAADIVSVQIPMLQAAAALSAKDSRRAIAILNAATPYERSAGPWLQYLRGLAHMAVREYGPALEQFRALIARPGSQPTSIAHPLARLQLARAASAAGDTALARQAYADFATAWHKADPRHPLRAAAAAEAAALPSTPATPTR
jgi:tetratricopeptide (TPR) repeat protein